MPIANKLNKAVIYDEELPPIKLNDPLIMCGLVRSNEKLNTLYLHFQKTYGYQTRQDGDLTWEAPTRQFICLFDHVTNWKNCISTFTGLMATKTGKEVTSERRLRMQRLKSSPTSCLNTSILFYKQCLKWIKNISSKFSKRSRLYFIFFVPQIFTNS